MASKRFKQEVQDFVPLHPSIEKRSSTPDELVVHVKPKPVRDGSALIDCKTEEGVSLEGVDITIRMGRFPYEPPLIQTGALIYEIDQVAGFSEQGWTPIQNLSLVTYILCRELCLIDDPTSCEDMTVEQLEQTPVVQLLLKKINNGAGYLKLYRKSQHPHIIEWCKKTGRDGS